MHSRGIRATIGRSSSQGSITDYLKRKREANDREEADRIRKELQATSKSANGEGEIDNMDAILKKLEGMESSLKNEMRIVAMESNEELKKEILEIRTELAECKGQWNKEAAELKEELRMTRNKLEELERKEERRGIEERKKNIIISGVKMADAQPVNATIIEKFLNDNLEINVNVEKAYRLKKGNLVFARLNSEKEKSEVMKNKAKLKRRVDEKIYIDDDLSEAERKTQKAIRDWAKREKYEKGREVKVAIGKVKVSDKWLAWKGPNEKYE